MAELVVNGSELVLKLTWSEKIRGFHANLRTPLTSIQSVSVPSIPWQALRGWRMTGFGIRGLVVMGTWRHGNGFDFAVLRRDREAVQIDISPIGRFARWVVDVPPELDVHEEADRIADAAGITRPRRD